jgi:hypothetical protein
MLAPALECGGPLRGLRCAGLGGLTPPPAVLDTSAKSPPPCHSERSEESRLGWDTRKQHERFLGSAQLGMWFNG